MILKLSNLDRGARDVVLGLAAGYERDAREGIPMAEQLARLKRWHNDGWPLMQYHYHVLAVVIGYAGGESDDSSSTQ